MEWQDDPKDRAPMTEAIEETNKYIVALGYISTCVPEMIIDVENPLDMMRQVYDRFDKLRARVAELEAENERLREKCSRVGEYLNLIFIELYGFAGATMHENGLKTLKSLRAFLDDTEGLSDEYIAKELKRNGIDPEALVKRGLAMIEKTKAALEVDGGKDNG